MLPDSVQNELQRLLAGLTEELLGPEELAALATLLRTDPSARAFYHEYMEMHSLLHWHHASPLPGPTLEPAYAAFVDSAAQEEQRCRVGQIPLLGEAAHSPLSYLSSGWPVAYLVATMVIGLGLLVGAVIRVSQPAQMAEHTPPQPTAIVATKGVFVGRITGMIDCEWADPTTAVPGLVAVPLGRKYALASGLLEITYDTGARVILQDSCTYELDSPTAGYLSIGKLTARVESRESRVTRPLTNPKPQIALDSQLSTLDYLSSAPPRPW